MSFRCLGEISVTSPGYWHVDSLALRSDCPSMQCRHPPRANHDMARKIAVVNVGLADDQASHQQSPSRVYVASWRSLFFTVVHPAFESRITRD